MVRCSWFFWELMGSNPAWSILFQNVFVFQSLGFEVIGHKCSDFFRSLTFISDFVRLCPTLSDFVRLCPKWFPNWCRRLFHSEMHLEGCAIWYHTWYHKLMILAMISYALNCLWYHIPMISYAYDIMILYLWYHTTAVYDISNLWYHRSMISHPISYAKSYMISWNQNYDIILLNLWYQ